MPGCFDEIGGVLAIDCMRVGKKGDRSSWAQKRGVLLGKGGYKKTKGYMLFIGSCLHSLESSGRFLLVAPAVSHLLSNLASLNQVQRVFLLHTPTPHFLQVFQIMWKLTQNLQAHRKCNFRFHRDFSTQVNWAKPSLCKFKYNILICSQMLDVPINVWPSQ